ncbi:MAG: hypothetical protein PF637_13675 [Spirochaetes bacterium]|nr:hypothetical protein [Spirochaetota bacterium]
MIYCVSSSCIHTPDVLKAFMFDCISSPCIHTPDVLEAFMIYYANRNA